MDTNPCNFYLGISMINGGSFILMLDPKKHKTLLGLRSRETEWNPNTWCPFGGTIESNEIPTETAIREYLEETNISNDKYEMSKEPIFVKKSVDSTGQIHQMFLYLGLLQCGIEPVINDEHQDFMWCDIKEIPTLELHPIMVDVFTDDYSLEAIQSALVTNMIDM